MSKSVRVIGEDDIGPIFAEENEIMSDHDGGGAFPREDYQPGEDRGGQRGMSLRDYFAGQALMGLAAFSRNENSNEPEHFARWSYALADAMLKARGE